MSATVMPAYWPYVVHSPDDGGYYVEIVDNRTGAVVEVHPRGNGKVYSRRHDAARVGAARAESRNRADSEGRTA